MNKIIEQMKDKKYIIMIIFAILLIAIFCFFKFRSTSLKDALKNAENYQFYEMECSMEMLENDELKSYQVTSTFAHIDDNDYYKVELYDKSLNQSQVIVRNEEGVFVLTPSLNQAFQFQSEWPLNSPKPYIYQSLITFLKENKNEKVKDGYIVNGDMSYENDERVKSQEVKFDKELNPIYVNVFDENGTELIQLTVTSFQTDMKLKKDDFQQETIMKNTQNQYKNVSSSLPLYPVALMGSTLENENISQVNDTTNHVLKFTGEKAFTIVESASSSQETMNVIQIHSDLIDTLDGFAYIENNQMTYVSSGIVCSLYSNDLTKDEMLVVLSSMQSAQVK